MREIEINGRKFWYEIRHEVSEHGDYDWTDFYLPFLEEEKVWNWRKFKFIKTGRLINNQKKVFTINFDLHNPRVTKKEIRERLER